MTDYFDDLEHRDPETRERALMAALPDQIARAQTATSGFARILDGVPAPEIDTRAALARLPVTRKTDLIEMQKSVAPFGGLNATPANELRRLFMSPGPIADPQGHGPDWFRFARALFAAGFRSGDIVHNCFSYHFTPAGFMMEDAATTLGCAVFPGGAGNTDAQVEAIAHFGATAFAGTPDFLKIILDRADTLGVDIRSLTKAAVGGGALFPALRTECQSRGIQVRQSYGSADCGLIAYESEAMEGLILDESIIVEIVRPGTNEVVSDGETGEVVVTLLNPDYPLIRFATGDLSAMLAGASPCGRTAPRIKGWLGRADQAAKVRGMFVHPGQIDAVLKRLTQEGVSVARARLNIGNEDGRDTATLVCECSQGNDALAARISTVFTDICKVRAAVEFIAPGGLAKDGKIIDDTRTYE